MSNFGLSCDVCNRENIGVTWVNGMKFCAKCYQETFGNKNMTENNKICQMRTKKDMATQPYPNHLEITFLSYLQ